MAGLLCAALLLLSSCGRTQTFSALAANSSLPPAGESEATAAPASSTTETGKTAEETQGEEELLRKQEEQEGPPEFECPPLGLESLRVKDAQLRASSFKRRGLGPHRGRLNIQSGVEDGDIYDGAWCARHRDKNQWLEVDARRLTRFTGVVLQGRNSIWSWDVVHSYKVQFSNDTLVWRPSMNGSQEANPFDMTRDWAPREHTPTPDDSFFRWLAAAYASTNQVMSDPDRRPCHNKDFLRNNNIINGAAWHNVPGSMNDFSYLHTNCFEITVELSCDKFPHASELPLEWRNNRESLLVFMEQVHRGIKGVIRDRESGEGIAGAVIKVEEIDHHIRSVADGDFWRLLNPGEYQLTVTAEGYMPSSRTCWVRYDQHPTVCDFHLTRIPKRRLKGVPPKGRGLPKDPQLRLRQLRLRKLRSSTKNINQRRAAAAARPRGVRRGEGGRA